MNHQDPSNPDATTPQVAQSPGLSFRASWDRIALQIEPVSACVERESEFASGHLRARLDRLTTFLDSQPDCDDVLENYDALVTLLPLTETNDVEFAVRKGVVAISRNQTYRRNWIQLFWYPALVMLAALLIGIFISVSVEPEITATLDGIRGSDMGFPSGVTGTQAQSPLLVRASKGMAAFLRNVWPMILTVLLLVPSGAIWLNYAGRRKNCSNFGWWDDFSISVRGALAMWADHLSVLLKAGIEQHEAFAFASKQAPKEALRKLSDALANRESNQPKTPRHYFPLMKYAMLDHALKQNSTAIKTTTLDEVAFYYRQRDKLVSSWWLSWLSTAMLWITGLAVLVAVLPLYAQATEMIQLISGLTTN